MPKRIDRRLYMARPARIIPFLPTRSEREPMGVARKVLVIRKAEERKPISKPVVAPSSWAYRGRNGIIMPKPSTTMAAEKERARTGRIKTFDFLSAQEENDSCYDHGPQHYQGCRKHVSRK